MKLVKTALAMSLVAAFSTSVFADTNVALNKSVSILPGSVPLNNSLSLITDGFAPANGTVWNSPASVYWQSSGYSGFQIDLGNVYKLSSVTISFDNNDQYVLVTDGSVFLPFGLMLNGGGMNSTTINFANPLTTSKISIFSATGDGYYSIAEVNAQGVLAAVPEPETYAMFLAGLGLIGGLARRRKQA